MKGSPPPSDRFRHPGIFRPAAREVTDRNLERRDAAQARGARDAQTDKAFRANFVATDPVDVKSSGPRRIEVTPAHAESLRIARMWLERGNIGESDKAARGELNPVRAPERPTVPPGTLSTQTLTPGEATIQRAWRMIQHRASGQAAAVTAGDAEKGKAKEAEHEP